MNRSLAWADLPAPGDADRGLVAILGDVIDADDACTGAHSRGVQELCLAIADRLNLDPSERREVEFTALLHDVGKLRIPNEIISKPGPLTPAERAVIDRHPAEGERLLAQAGGFLAHVGALVRSCHERFDGAGYPDRLAGDEIPLVARIVACCDAYDAMTSDRPYRAAMSAPRAVRELRAGAGGQFDPDVVEALLAVLGAGEAPARHEPPVLALVPPEVGAARDSVPGIREAVRERVQIERFRARARVAPAVAAYLPGGVFAALALALPLGADLSIGLHTIALFVALAGAYAIAYGIEFEIGPGSAVPTQLVFVPMLALLPAALVPLAVLAAILARAGWDPSACSCPSRQRPFVLLAGGWYTLGPVALLLWTGGPLTWPLLVIALASQIAIDAAVSLLRVSAALGYPAGPLTRSLAWAYVTDLALTPAALLIVAPAVAGAVGAAAAVAGLLGFLALVASDRRRHLDQATNLADAYRAAADRARRDPLTGLANRLGWDEALAQIRPDQHAAVILLDVNGLKAANDTRGHRFGDELLAEVARTIAAGLPEAEITARLGGDEFGVLLLGDAADAVGAAADRLGGLFADHPGLDGHVVSAAIGCASIEPGADPQSALARADRAVYADKRPVRPLGRPPGRPVQARFGRATQARFAVKGIWLE